MSDEIHVNERRDGSFLATQRREITSMLGHHGHEVCCGYGKTREEARRDLIEFHTRRARG